MVFVVLCPQSLANRHPWVWSAPAAHTSMTLITALSSLQPHIQIIPLFPSVLPVKQDRNRSHERPSDNPEHRKRCRSLFSVMNEEPTTSESVLNTPHIVLGECGAGARKKITKFPIILSVAFSWLVVCLVATNPKLISRVPIRLLWSLCCILLGISIRE